MSKSTATTTRLMPLLCFNCGMPGNNKLQTYDCLLASGMAPKEIFESLGIQSMCCRQMIFTAPEETRLKRELPKTTSFVQIQYASRLQAAPYTVYADGKTEPVPTALGML